MAKSRSLNFIFGGNATKFHKTLGGVTRGVGKAAKATVAAGAAAAAASAAIWAKALKGAADYADQVGKTAKKTGLSTDELQRLTFAANLSGAELGNLSKSVLRMHRTVGDLEDGTKEAKDAFGAIGIGIKDLEGLSPDEKFNKISEAIAGVADAGKRADLAQTIFGRGGAELLPMLEGGAEGFRNLKKERESLGPLMTPEQIASAEGFNDSLSRMKESAKANLFQGLATAFPELTDIINNFAANNGFEKLTPAIQAFGAAMVDIVGKIAEFAQNEELVAGMVTLFESIAEVATVAAEAIAFLIEKFAAAQKFLGDTAETLTGDLLGPGRQLLNFDSAPGEKATIGDKVLQGIFSVLTDRLPEANPA